MLSTPVQDFIFESVKDSTHVFALTVKKPFPKFKGGVEAFQQFLVNEVGGINNLEMVGMYTIVINVAKTFDPQQIQDIIAENLSQFQSDLDLPSPGISKGHMKLVNS